MAGAREISEIRILGWDAHGEAKVSNTLVKRIKLDDDNFTTTKSSVTLHKTTGTLCTTRYGVKTRRNIIIPLKPKYAMIPTESREEIQNTFRTAKHCCFIAKDND
uniref:Uncharacterized protein n=1 Tax=Glossina pallidipes TaxID=7398 RepID=A0A1A9Z9Y4_GLOPL